MGKTVGQMIAKWRKAKCETQEQLAYALGCSRGAVAKWENDENALKAPDIISLAKHFGITTDALLLGSFNQQWNHTEQACQEQQHKHLRTMKNS